MVVAVVVAAAVVEGVLVVDFVLAVLVAEEPPAAELVLVLAVPLAVAQSLLVDRVVSGFSVIPCERAWLLVIE